MAGSRRSVADGIVVRVKEGGYTPLREVKKKERKAVQSDLLGVFSSAVANSSAAKFVPPPKKDKYGFLIKPKVARGPGEAFVGRDDPKWLAKIYTNYRQYAVKLPNPEVMRRTKSMSQLQDQVDDIRENRRRRSSRKGCLLYTSPSPRDRG